MVNEILHETQTAVVYPAKMLKQVPLSEKVIRRFYELLFSNG